MFFPTKNKELATRKNVERKYHLLAHHTIFNGFLDTRVRFENYNRDVQLNLYDTAAISKKSYSISCVYAAQNPVYWENIANLHPHVSGVSIFPALGLMASGSMFAPHDWEKTLKYHLTMNPKMLIGEIGLDLTQQGQSMSLEAQKELFKKQLNTAVFWGRSVLLSAPNALPEMIQILQEENRKLPPAMILPATQVSYQLLPQLQNIPNLYYSFSPYVMDSRGYNERRVLHKTPLNRILLESKTKIKNCNSANLPYVANFIAKNLHIERKQLYAALLKNSQRILGD